MGDQPPAPPVVVRELHEHATLHKPQVCGGMSEDRPADEHIKKIVGKVRKHVEAKHGPLEDFTVESYRVQVVAGTNYDIKLRIGPNKVVDIRVFEPLPHTGKEPELVQ